MTHYFYWIRFIIFTLLVGIVAGLGAIFFRDLIALVHNLLFYGEISTAYDFFQHAAPSRWGIGIIFIPVIGAAVVAFLVKHFAPEAKGHGVPEVMDAIHYNGGNMRPIVSIIKALASSISIGSGGSIGREGPIIQIGAAFGSTIGRWIKMRETECITLIACGAGAGIAATFHTPIGGILFAIEVMLLELYASTVIPIIVATAAGTYICHLFIGNTPFIPSLSYTVPTTSAINIITYIILSIAVGLMSVFFIVSIYFAEDMFEKIPGGYYVRHMTGMFFIGVNMFIMMYFFGHYYIEGVGYATVFDVLMSVLSHPGFLLFLAVLKVIDTSVTLGSGGSGGVFSPLLFIGATLGASVIGICNYFLPASAAISLQIGALAGMAGIVGASTGAPITAVVMVVEMTNNLLLILPLMIVVALSYAIRRFIIKDSIYTLKLTRRGHIISVPKKTRSAIHPTPLENA